MLNLNIKSKASILPAYLWTPHSFSEEYMLGLSDEDANIDPHWKLYGRYFSTVEDVIGLITVGNEPKLIDYDNSGISFLFSKLKSTKDIEEFSKIYGLLGVTPPDKWKTSQIELPNFSEIIHDLKYGKSYFEPLILWEWHIKNVRRLLKLYRALLKESGGDSVEIEENLLTIEKLDHRGYGVFWSDGEFTYIDIDKPEDRSYIELAKEVLAKSIALFLEGGVNIYPSKIVENKKKSIGFHIAELRSTHHLLAAIYYDLWQQVNESTKITLCGSPECKLPIQKKGRKTYCNDACKSAAWRYRKLKNN
ncbi:hypothetical protein JSY36_12935 [Bacillus sp. H-16]|uniref:hypothetical protein n=1 Tax=Alteribacter salitolerans TaxID=2912333 RepID=UPI001962B1EF|nr:hypothetical protein [Alteribacter salitolerans]MBM7096653.1 hypothetical protein [Alteribacter salitolerans]